MVAPRSGNGQRNSQGEGLRPEAQASLFPALFQSQQPPVPLPIDDLPSEHVSEITTAPASRVLPPMLVDYQRYQQRYPDCVIFYQVGDFYEVFFEAARRVAGALHLTLTTRDRNDPDPIPMCGVPVANVDTYLERLVDAGFSVAVVSQVSKGGQSAASPAAGLDASPPAGVSPRKGPMERELTRMMTPGVRIASLLDDEAEERVLAAIACGRADEFAVATASVVQHAVRVWESLSDEELVEVLRRISPVEILLPSSSGSRSVDRRLGWVKHIERSVPSSALRFRALGASQGPDGHRVLSALAGFHALSGASKDAVRLMVEYLDEVAVSGRIGLREVERASEEGVLVIDGSTRDNLELVRNVHDGTSRHSLYEAVNRCVTLSGARLLRRWLVQPSAHRTAIVARQDVVAWVRNSPAAQNAVREVLLRLADLERIASRIDVRALSPREAGALRDSFLALEQLQAMFRPDEIEAMPEYARVLWRRLSLPRDAYDLLDRALVPSPPASFGEAEVFRAGYSSELDHFRALRTSGSEWMSEFEASERRKTGIASLKVKYNGMLGFFIEVTRANAARVPQQYLRRQSTAQTERFTTPELVERAAQTIGAEERVRAIERHLFEELRAALLPAAPAIRDLGQCIAEIDVLWSFAMLACQEGWVRPVLTDGCELVLEDAKHPVLAGLLGGQFIANSLRLGTGNSGEDVHRSADQDQRGDATCALLTGPNMGGKSTYLRQAALLVVLAQIGSCVPARRAFIGVVDRLFARIGASDNISEGESTFMVEMRETAYILSHATKRSLVLIDEVGRGTATSDGVAIARAVLERLLTGIGARTLFATHFHELTALSDCYPQLQNLSVGSIESDHGLLFTHEIKAGPASRSYGLEVARLAGLPAHVLSRARELLGVQASSVPVAESDIASRAVYKEERPLEDHDANRHAHALAYEIVEAVRSYEIASSSPLAALNFLADLQEHVQGVERRKADAMPGAETGRNSRR